MCLVGGVRVPVVGYALGGDWGGDVPEVAVRHRGTLSAFWGKLKSVTFLKVGNMSIGVGGMADYLSYNLKPPASVPSIDIAGYQTPIANCTFGGLYKSGNTLSHDGATGVSKADLRINPTAGYGYAVMFNSGDVGGATGALLSAVASMHNNWASI